MTSELLARWRAGSNTKLVALLGLSGLACLGLGITSIVTPTANATRLGYAFAKAGTKGEFMVFYGAFYAGIGLFLLTATRLRSLRPGATAFLAFSASAAFPVRVYSLVQFNVSGLIFYQLLVGELLFAAAGFLGWYWIDRTEGRKSVPGGEHA